jgi:hypothetical protein
MVFAGTQIGDGDRIVMIDALLNIPYVRRRTGEIRIPAYQYYGYKVTINGSIRRRNIGLMRNKVGLVIGLLDTGIMVHVRQ